MLHHLLESIRDDYTMYNDQEWIDGTPTPQDINDVRAAANKNNKWDDTQLRLRLWKDWIDGSATLRAYTCPYGRVICLAPATGDATPTPTPLWIRACRILGEGAHVRVLWFASQEKRIPPSVGNPIEPKHINGGYTSQCDAKSIVLYRAEEALRVLLHELLHASCSDPEDANIALLEADTEAFAEVILVALKAKGVSTTFYTLWDIQAHYAVDQAAAAETYYKVSSPSDYAWRYLTGRLARFASYTLPIPPPTKTLQPLTSLRLTPESFEQ